MIMKISFLKLKIIHIYLWSIIVVFSAIYCTAVLGDYLLYKSLQAKRNEMASMAEGFSIRRARAANEDVVLRKEVRAKGFEPIFFPALLDRYKVFRELAVKHAIAPLASKPNSHVYYCNEGFGMVTYQTDRFGFRNDDSVWDENIQTILIGDSFTQGACVQNGDTIADQLQKIAPTLSLGASSSGPTIYAATAKTFVPAVSPKNVVMIFYPNDNIDTDDSPFYYEKYLKGNMQYLTKKNNGKLEPVKSIKGFYDDAMPIVEKHIEEKGLLVGNKSPEAFIDRLLIRGDILNRVVNYLKLTTTRQQLKLHLFGKIQSQLPSSTRLAVDVLTDLCKKVGCQPFVVYIPNSSYWSPDLRAEDYARLLSAYSTERGATFIDTTKVLEDDGLKSYAPKGPHLSPLGYRLVANEIAHALGNP